jgi:hypothetical protein
MGVIEDVRKVVQDLVTPDLKAEAKLIRGNEASSKLRDDALSAEIRSLREFIEVSNRALNAKIDSNHATVIYALNIDKRVEAVERNQQQQIERRSETASAAS